MVEEEIRDFEEKIQDNYGFPKLKRKRTILSNFFKNKDSGTKQAENNSGQNELKFNEEFFKNMAEAKKMIEEEKYELKKYLTDSLANSIKELSKQKAESDKKILEEINNLKIQIEENKIDSNQNLISKIVQLRHRLDEGKEEIKKETDIKLDSLKKELEQQSKKSLDNFSKRILEQKQLKEEKIASLTPIPLILPEKQKLSPISSMPNFHDLNKEIKTPKQNFAAVFDSNFPLKPEKSAKKRFSNTLFIEEHKFNNIHNTLKDFKKIVSDNLSIMQKDIDIKKTMHSKNMNNFNYQTEKIKENLSYISSIFPKIR